MEAEGSSALLKVSPWSDEKYMTRGALWEQNKLMNTQSLIYGQDKHCVTLCVTSHHIFHHREEEKGSNVAKTVDVLMDCGERLPQILRPLQL